MRKTGVRGQGSEVKKRCEGLFVPLLATGYWLLVTISWAGEVTFGNPFGIGHPDKRVSPPAIGVYEGRIYLSWAREEGDVYLTVLSNDGKTVEAPVKVNNPSSLANGIHQGPGMAIGPKGEVYLTWVSPRDGDESASDIRFVSSLDGGNTFLSLVVNDSTAPGSRGFESIAVSRDGTIYIAWLDGRDKKGGSSSVYLARSIDGGKTFERNIKLDDNACPCCRTAVATGPDSLVPAGIKQGIVYVSYRKVFPGDIRDMVVARSLDDGKRFQGPMVVSQDGWAIQACPHRGPSMAVDEKGILYYIWYTEGSDGFPGIYLSKSMDKGNTFTARQPLPVGIRVFPDHPRLAVGHDGTAYIVWEEKTPVVSKILFTTYRDGKGFTQPQEISHGPRRSYEPIVVGDDGMILIGWAYDEIRFTRTVVKIGKEQGAESKE